MTDEAKIDENDRKEIDYTVQTLNATFETVQFQLARSNEHLRFPKTVDFKDTSLDSLSGKAAASTVRELARLGHLVIAVEPVFTSPLSSVSQCSFFNGNQAKEERFIGVFFPGNFFARCIADGPNPEDVVRKVIGEIVYQDALMAAQKTPRAFVPLKGGNALVRFYHGPRLAQR